MANLVMNNSLSVSPTVGGQPAISQIFTTALSVATYSESVVTPPNTVVTLASLIGSLGTSALRLRNITPSTVAGSSLIQVSTGGVVIAILAPGQEMVIVGSVAGSLVSPFAVQQTGTATAGLTQLYVLTAT